MLEGFAVWRYQDLRESEEDKEGDGYDDGKSDPATPTVPGRVIAIIIPPIVAILKSDKETTMFDRCETYQ